MNALSPDRITKRRNLPCFAENSLIDDGAFGSRSGGKYMCSNECPENNSKANSFLQKSIVTSLQIQKHVHE